MRAVVLAKCPFIERKKTQLAGKVGLCFRMVRLKKLETAIDRTGWEHLLYMGKHTTYTRGEKDWCGQSASVWLVILWYVLRRFSLRPFGGSVTT